MNVDSTILMQLGVGGILAILILDKVFDFINKFIKNRNASGIIAGSMNSDDKEKLSLCVSRLNDLWQWHNVNDSDGVKVWYMKSSFVDAIMQLNDSIKAQTELIHRLMLETKETK